MVLDRNALRDRLEEIRMNTGHSQDQLSKDIGIGLSTIGWFLRNEREIYHKTYSKILKYVIKMEKELEIV